LYGACMARELASVDDALLRLRRMWSPDRSAVIDDAGTPVQMSSLLVIEACARASGPEVTVGDVAAFLDVAPSTASRLVDRAELAGLVSRAPSGVNSRRTAILLTDKGSDLQQRAYRARVRWLAEMLHDWNDLDVATLGRLLSRFATAVEHGHP
jgi:DNA-binding MarR family transcriptional regulator